MCAVCARLLLLAVNMNMQSEFTVGSVTSICSIHELDFPRATQQLFQSSVAKATCFFFCSFVRKVDRGMCSAGQLFSVFRSAATVRVRAGWLCGRRTHQLEAGGRQKGGQGQDHPPLRDVEGMWENMHGQAKIHYHLAVEKPAVGVKATPAALARRRCQRRWLTSALY